MGGITLLGVIVGILLGIFGWPFVRGLLGRANQG